MRISGMCRSWNLTSAGIIRLMISCIPCLSTSNPILYYNKDLFKDAGLDPESPPKTFEELKVAADTISKRESGRANFAIYGWFMEQLFANQGAEYVNNGNGRMIWRPSRLVNTEPGVKVLTWWKDLIDSKAPITWDVKPMIPRRHFRPVRSP